MTDAPEMPNRTHPHVAHGYQHHIDRAIKLQQIIICLRALNAPWLRGFGDNDVAVLLHINETCNSLEASAREGAVQSFNTEGRTTGRAEAETGLMRVEYTIDEDGIHEVHWMVVADYWYADPFADFGDPPDD